MNLTRAMAFLGVLTGAVGCFTAPQECPIGTLDCPCSDLQCEAGLTCQDARCVGGAGATGTDTATTDPATTNQPMTSSSGGGTTAPMTSTTVSVDGTASSTTAPADSSSGGSSSSTGIELCGNAVLDPEEECDGTPGCTECVLDNYDCNPLNNAPCPVGFKCSIVDDKVQGVDAVCLPFVEPPPGQLYESNCYNFVPQDNWCDLGLACALSQSVGACDVNCCVEFCDLTDATFVCDYLGASCQPLLGAQAPEGLLHLGYCIGGDPG